MSYAHMHALLTAIFLTSGDEPNPCPGKAEVDDALKLAEIVLTRCNFVKLAGAR